jgi:hypothetical protein
VVPGWIADNFGELIVATFDGETITITSGGAAKISTLFVGKVIMPSAGVYAKIRLVHAVPRDSGLSVETGPRQAMKHKGLLIFSKPFLQPMACLQESFVLMKNGHRPEFHVINRRIIAELATQSKIDVIHQSARGRKKAPFCAPQWQIIVPDRKTDKNLYSV